MDSTNLHKTATKATATQDALKETKAMTTVIDVALASENAEIDRCTGAVLREGVIMHHEEIKQRIIDLVIEKLTNINYCNVTCIFYVY